VRGVECERSACRIMMNPAPIVAIVEQATNKYKSTKYGDECHCSCDDCQPRYSNSFLVLNIGIVSAQIENKEKPGINIGPLDEKRDA
jgi:hypothetical protein